jgi:hypothetical protein
VAARRPLRPIDQPHRIGHPERPHPRRSHPERPQSDRPHPHGPHRPPVSAAPPRSHPVRAPGATAPSATPSVDHRSRVRRPSHHSGLGPTKGGHQPSPVHGKAARNNVEMTRSCGRTPDRERGRVRGLPRSFSHCGNRERARLPRVTRIPHAVDDLSSRAQAGLPPRPADERRALREGRGQLMPMAAASATLTEGNRCAVRFASWREHGSPPSAPGDNSLPDRARLRRPGGADGVRNRCRAHGREQCPSFASPAAINPVTDSRDTTRKRRRVTSHGCGHTPCTHDSFTLNRFKAVPVERGRTQALSGAAALSRAEQ